MIRLPVREEKKARPAKKRPDTPPMTKGNMQVGRLLRDHRRGGLRGPRGPAVVPADPHGHRVLDRQGDPDPRGQGPGPARRHPRPGRRGPGEQRPRAQRHRYPENISREKVGSWPRSSGPTRRRCSAATTRPSTGAPSTAPCWSRRTPPKTASPTSWSAPRSSRRRRQRRLRPQLPGRRCGRAHPRLHRRDHPGGAQAESLQGPRQRLGRRKERGSSTTRRCCAARPASRCTRWTPWAGSCPTVAGSTPWAGSWTRTASQWPVDPSRAARPRRGPRGGPGPQPHHRPRPATGRRGRAGCRHRARPRRRLRRDGGAAVAMDPRNGEILALASRPNFDPQLLSAVSRAPGRCAPSST